MRHFEGRPTGCYVGQRVDAALERPAPVGGQLMLGGFRLPDSVHADDRYCLHALPRLAHRVPAFKPRICFCPLRAEDHCAACGVGTGAVQGRRSRPLEWYTDGHSVISFLRLCGAFGGQVGSVVL